MTDKLYYENQFLEEWQSEVKDIIQEKDKFLIVLASTAFFPGGGGQPADKGYIEDIEAIRKYLLFWHRNYCFPISRLIHTEVLPKSFYRR